MGEEPHGWLKWQKKWHIKLYGGCKGCWLSVDDHLGEKKSHLYTTRRFLKAISNGWDQPHDLIINLLASSLESLDDFLFCQVYFICTEPLSHSIFVKIKYWQDMMEIMHMTWNGSFDMVGMIDK